MRTPRPNNKPSLLMTLSPLDSSLTPPTSHRGAADLANYIIREWRMRTFGNPHAPPTPTDVVITDDARWSLFGAPWLQPVASSAGSPRAADGQQTPEIVSAQPCGGNLRSDGRTASITPEVAGSSPVAPVKSCKLAYVFDIITAGFFSPRAHPARESASNR